MKKTNLSNKNINDGELMGNSIGNCLNLILGNLGQSGKDFGVNSSNAASLKGKLQNLEV